MPQLLLKLSILTIGILLLMNGLGYLSDQIAPVSEWHEPERMRYANLLDRRAAIQAVVVGNSHSDSIDFDVLGLEGQSLARAGTDLFEMEQYIKVITPQLPQLEVVFITVSYYTFSWDTAMRENLRIRRIEMYDMLPIWQPILGDGDNLVLGKLHGISRLMSVARPDHWRSILYERPAPAPAEEASAPEAEGSLADQAQCEHLTRKEMEAHAENIAGLNATATKAMAQAHPGLQADTTATLARLIERLQANDVRVILYTPPYYDSYTRHFSEQVPGTIEAKNAAVKYLQAQYQIEYFDFSNDPAIINRPELFFNSDHVNNCGRKAFTEHLLQAMSAKSRYSGAQ